VAVDKARTAAIFIRPSRELEQQVSSGRLGALALHGARALTGGIPLKVGDEVVGAVGTSGETPDEEWRVLEPAETQLRLSQGRVCFNWYRIGAELVAGSVCGRQRLGAQDRELLVLVGG
jgi:hypothetical protein